MRIDRGKCKKVLTEVPVNCKSLILKLKTCTEDDLVKTLRDITVWEYGKCELYHWIDVLDRFDLILARVSQPESSENQALIYLCRRLEEKQLKNLVYYVLYFTALLIEHAYARHLYSSIEHLTTLLAASDMDIVLAVLNLLYVFSKRSNFISRLSLERRLSLQLRLNHLAESWGGKENGFGLASCCEDKPLSEFPPTATTLHYEFYISGSNGASSHRVIQLDKMDTYNESSARIMEELVPAYMVPTGKQMGLLTHIRLAQAFSDYSRRLQCVQARLQAISILVYSNAGQDILQSLLYPGLIEELVDVLGVNDARLTDIKAAALRTLTAIIHLERTPRINAIIDATGMSSYHGFFPSLFRGCVLAMIGESSENPLPPTLSTALFSFLYHLASYESGGEALVSCGMMETLLRIVQWRSIDNSQLTFVTRAVRLVDLITNMDITTFTNFSGLTCLISRLEYEVNTCRTELGEENILTSPSHPFFDGDDTPLFDKDAMSKKQGESSSTPLELTAITLVDSAPSTSTQEPSTSSQILPKTIKARSQCIPQRSALLKSILNFLKKAIPDPTFSDCIRNVMDNSLPTSLKHIISKAEYYGPSLFLLGTEVVTVYVFHEPSLLSCLQDRKLTDVILDALVVKEVPPTREVIASLPNILSALCLNQRGLEAFMKCKPFDRLFHVLLSPQYLPAMRRRRSSDSLGDTATNLGTAMDELMRHQPTLRQDAMTAIIQLLKEVCDMGEDERISVQSMSLIETDRQEEKGEDGSDEDDDIEDNGAITKPGETEETATNSKGDKKRSVPLMEYIYNVVRFIDAILSNNATDDHCREFVRQGGLDPLVRIPSLPNVVIEFSSSPACMGVGMALKGILTLSQEGTVIDQCLNQIDILITKLEPLFTPTNESALLNELTNSRTPTQPFHSCKSTPLLHTITALESYTTLLINLCKVGQVDLRTVCIAQWGNRLTVIDQLAKLFTAIVWESTLLDMLCPPHNHTDRPDLQRFIEVIGPNPQISFGNEQKSKDKKEKSSPPHIRLIKPLWRAASGLCGHLTPFLSVLCKLSCGSTVRVRRTQNYPPAPSKQQHEMAEHIIGLIIAGLKWRPPDNSSPRASLTFLNCAIGLAAQLLFSDQQQPYHLMLQEFNKGNGLQLLVECYDWANKLPRQDDELADGSGEFLNVWLGLTEKLINVKLITETTHSLPSTASPTHKPFDPLIFLSKSHKYTFDVVSGLWKNLTYSYANMKTLKPHIGVLTENVIIILKHLLKGDLQDLLRKKTGDVPSSTTAGESSSTAETPAESSVVPAEHLIVQLVDMGFSFQRACEALIHSNNNLSAATEYVLTRPLASFPMTDSDLTEEEAMMQAIAMSLGVGEGGEDGEETPEEEEEIAEELVQVTEKELWTLYDKILSGCIKLLEDVPSAVFRIGDLLAVAMDRRGDVFRSDTIANIVPLVVDGVLYVSDSLLKGSYSSQANSKNVAVLGAYLHCLLLISEDLKFSCGELFTETSLFHEHLLNLLRLYCDNIVREGLTDGKPPGWLTPLILLFDNHEKMATMVQRRSALPKIEHIWQYYEERHGRWVNYHSTSNTTIEKAYKAGESEVTFTSGRRHYLVLFSIMTQINEENGTPRPVMRVAKPSQDKTTKTRLLQEFLNAPTPEGSTAPGSDEGGKDSGEEMEVENKVVVQHFTETESAEIVVLCTQILGHVKEPDSVQAILRLLLRFTRNYKHAQLFAENKGLQHLIGLKEVSSFPGFSPLSTLIIRHMLEDVATLQSTIDNTIINFIMGNIGDDIPELRSGSLNSAKEIHNLLQKLIPIGCRDEELFVEGCKRMLRYTIPTSTIKGLNDFSDLSNVIKEPFTVKSSGEAARESPQISPLAKQCITCLLARLTVLHNCPSEESGESKPDEPPKVTWQPPEEPSSEPVRVSKKRRKTTHTEKDKEKKFLINKSSILKLLAESVKSYQGVAEFIIDHTVVIKDGETVSALTYIMDNLLAPPDKDSSLEDTHDYAKVILSTVAASNSSQAAKEKLVEQLKTSFNKALSTVESSFKHTKIQSLAGLMSIILESRVSGSNFVYNFGTVGGNSQSPPYIAKLLIAKGLVSDLAQVPHKLDLSSPHMASTINTCLKPLEILTRLIYQSVLANMPPVTDKDEEAEEHTSASPLRVDDIDNVVDQLLERVPTSSALGLTTPRHTNTLDDLALDHMDIDEVHRDFDEDEGDVQDTIDQGNALIQEFADGLNDAFNSNFGERATQSGTNPSIFDPGTPDDGDSFDDDDDDDDDDEDDEDDDADDHVDETNEEDEGRVDDAVDDDENAVEEDEDGSEMDGDEEDMEIEETSNLEGGNRTTSFNIRDFLNEEEDQFVTVMSSSRINSARTHFSWANPSPSARARARANGATSTGLPPRHPLLARESDTVAETTTGRNREEGHIRLQLDPASTTPAFLQRLLGSSSSTADAVFHLGSTRNTRTRLYLHDRDYIPSDLNDINPIVTGRAADAVSTPLPSALARWIEESLVLDGTSLQDLVQLIKPKILPTLEGHRDKEVGAIREVREAELKEEEKRIKNEIEEAKKKAEEEKVNNKTSTETSEPSEMGELPSSDSGTVDSSESEATSGPSTTSLPLADNPSPSELGPLLTSTLNMTSATSSEGSGVPSETVPPPPQEEEEKEESSVSSTDSVRTTEWISLPINTLPLAAAEPETSISSSTASILPTSTSDVPSSSSQPVPSESTTSEPEARNTVYIDGIAVPEGIDPSFLEALPDSIRREVLQEQSAALARQRRQQQQNAAPDISGVSPEFLAALPPHIQEEVLAQERMERGPTDPPQTAMNPSDFLMSLPSSLRQTVLADMEESQLPSLSQDLVDDYERLRTERARAVYNAIPPSFQRAFNIGSAARNTRTSLGPIFASTISPYTISGINNNGSPAYKEEMKKITSLQEEVRKVVKKNPVEHEAITCLLVLLFIDESRLHTTRLHRVLRNLCCHTTSRTWILISLLSIIQKCSTGRKTSYNTKFNKISLATFVNGTNSWLTLSMNTSLGCKNNVFDLNISSKGHMNSQEMIRIHPQASTVVCRRVLDLLVSLGRYFPNHFLSKSIIDSGLKYCSGPKEKKTPQAELLPSGAALTDFWDYLLGLEQAKGKAPCPKSSDKISPSSTFLACPMGQLMVMLDHPVVKNNQTLIDRLLRLLSVIALALPERTSDGTEGSKLEPLSEDCPEANIERHHLQLVTNILTTGASSEEGLEDGTSLLLQLSRVSARLRDLTLQLMLSGLQTVAKDLQEQIRQLLDELKEEHRKNPQKKQRTPIKDEKKTAIASSKVTLKAPHRDLHLPAMAHLTKKNSSQAYFLRILKVVVAVREVTIKSLQAEKDKETAEKEEKEKEEKEKAEAEKEEDKDEDNSEDKEEDKEEEEETSTMTEIEEKKEPEPTPTDKTAGMGPLSEQLKVPQLWSTLGECLSELGSSSDHHAVLVLQPAVEAFFHVHGLDNDVKPIRRRTVSGSLDLFAESPAPLSVEGSDSAASLASMANYSDMSVDTHKYIMFAEQHRVVLNQILRQSTTPLSDGPFQALVNHTRVLDFDVKRRYFRQELEKIEETNRREDIAIRVKREHVFEESFRELHRRSPEELKSRLYVIFEGEEGQDAGGLLREWYQIIAREIFNPHYALFTTTPGDKITYVCNSFSHYNSNHLDYFKFVGRVIAKAIYDNKHLDCYFSRSFYKHILGQPVGFRDMEAEDYAFYKSMMFLLENNLEECGLDNLEFTMDIEEFGVTECRELKPGGKNIRVTDANKKEYVKLISNMKMTGSIRSQIKAFLDGFYDIIPKHLISIFTDTELELLISGLPTIDIDDLKANTEYHKYQPTSLQIQWFWRALRSFSQAERANFLQFVTGTSKVPLQGFSSLEGMNGVQKFQIHRDDRSTDRLPSAHTCFNQLDLPVYETYDKLRKMLLLAINECPEGFGLA